VQKRGRRERARARVGERAEQQGERDQRDRRSDGAGADPARRVDDVPATAEARSHGRAEAIDDRPWTPGDQRGLLVVERLDKDATGRRNDDRLAEVDEVVVAIAGAGEPDAPVQHFELAAGRAEGQYAARAKDPEVAARGRGKGG